MSEIKDPFKESVYYLGVLLPLFSYGVTGNVAIEIIMVLIGAVCVGFILFSSNFFLVKLIVSILALCIPLRLYDLVGPLISKCWWSSKKLDGSVCMTFYSHNTLSPVKDANVFVYREDGLLKGEGVSTSDQDGNVNIVLYSQINLNGYLVISKNSNETKDTFYLKNLTIVKRDSFCTLIDTVYVK